MAVTGLQGEALVRSRGTGIGVHHGGAATLSRTPSAAAPMRTGPREGGHLRRLAGLKAGTTRTGRPEGRTTWAGRPGAGTTRDWARRADPCSAAFRRAVIPTPPQWQAVSVRFLMEESGTNVCAGRVRRRRANEHPAAERIHGAGDDEHHTHGLPVHTNPQANPSARPAWNTRKLPCRRAPSDSRT